MGGNVVTHDKFGGAAVIERLRASGVEIADALTDAQVAEMALKEPQYGERLIGECTQEEAALFHALWDAQRALDDATRNYMGHALQRLGSTISESDRKKPLDKLLADGEVSLDFDNEEDAEAFFRIQQRAAHLHAYFYWTVGERLGHHRERLGVRSKFRIVTVAPRYGHDAAGRR